MAVSFDPKQETNDFETPNSIFSSVELGLRAIISLNPSSPGNTIWRTQLLPPYSGYPHMVSMRSCSESRIPPYGVPYFTAKNNHLQFDWLIFDNSKQFFDCLSVF